MNDNYGLCLLGNKIFVGCRFWLIMIYEEEKIKLMKLEKNDTIYEIKQFMHPKKGQFIVAQTKSKGIFILLLNGNDI